MAEHHYVTGFDERFFLQHAVLAQALSLRDPGARLYVCDFGLSDAMRDYFERRGRLLRWSGRRKTMGAFTLKANLIEYVAPLTDHSLIWVDADAFPVASIGAAIGRDHRSMALWSTPDLGMASIGQFIEKYKAEAFRERCRQVGLDTGRTYLNSGFFIVNDPFFLRRWQEEAEAMPTSEVLFEQNAFNIAAYLYGNVGVLSDGMWNLHGADLMELACSDDGTALSAHCRGQRVQVLHATSEQESFHQKLPLDVEGASGRRLNWPVKLLKDEAVRRFQMKMVSYYIAANRGDLAASGVL